MSSQGRSLALFCPYCGDPLIWREERLFCESGQLEFSQHLGEQLLECYGERTREPVQRDSAADLLMPDDELHCPQCGVVMTGQPRFRCRQCGKSFNEFCYELIKFHFHWSTKS